MELITPELERLELASQLELIKTEIAASGVDGDAIPSGLDLTEEQFFQVHDLSNSFVDLKERFSKLKDTDGENRRLSPIDQLCFLDNEAQTAALMGKTEQAIGLFNEIWRLAMQMDIPKEAARAAKQKGDLEVVLAIIKSNEAYSKHFLQKSNHPDSNEEKEFDEENLEENLKPESLAITDLSHRKYLQSAISTYTEDGLGVANKLKDKYYTFLLSVQRLRAICLLIAGFDYRERVDNQEAIYNYLKLATEDIENINSKPWTDRIPPNLEEVENFSAYETCYYITPYLVWYRYLAKIVKFKEQPAPTSFESNDCILGSTFFSMNMIEDQLEEAKRKLHGLSFSKSP